MKCERGKAIWRTHPKRRPTEAQRQMLIARNGGCFACGANPDICDVHHVQPVAQGGPTELDNLVFACWQHHNAVHHFGWRIHGPPHNRTLHPPDHTRRGPAHAPDPPQTPGPKTTRRAQQRVPVTAGHRPVPDPPMAAPDAQPQPATAGDRAHRDPGPADGVVGSFGSGPAAARAVPRSATPVPLFTPD